MFKAKLIDKVITEPLGGAHFDREATFDTVKKEIQTAFRKLVKMDARELVNSRREKFYKMGVYAE